MAVCVKFTSWPLATHDEAEQGISIFHCHQLVLIIVDYNGVLHSCASKICVLYAHVYLRCCWCTGVLVLCVLLPILWLSCSCSMWVPPWKSLMPWLAGPRYSWMTARERSFWRLGLEVSCCGTVCRETQCRPENTLFLLKFYFMHLGKMFHIRLTFYDDSRTVQPLKRVSECCYLPNSPPGNSFFILAAAWGRIYQSRGIINWTSCWYWYYTVNFLTAAAVLLSFAYSTAAGLFVLM